MSMIRPPLETLLDKVDNKYALVISVAKRARQLKEGQLPMVDIPSTNPVTVALEEIAAGKVRAEKPTENIKEDYRRVALRRVSSGAGPVGSTGFGHEARTLFAFVRRLGAGGRAGRGSGRKRPDAGLQHALVDVKVAALDDVWSGLRFMFHLGNRRR